MHKINYLWLSLQAINVSTLWSSNGSYLFNENPTTCSAYNFEK